MGCGKSHQQWPRPETSELYSGIESHFGDGLLQLGQLQGQAGKEENKRDTKLANEQLGSEKASTLADLTCVLEEKEENKSLGYSKHYLLTEHTEGNSRASVTATTMLTRKLFLR